LKGVIFFGSTMSFASKVPVGPNLVFGSILVIIFLAVLIWMNVSFNSNNGNAMLSNSTTVTTQCANDANSARVRALFDTQRTTQLGVLSLLAEGESIRLVQDNAVKFTADANALSILDGSAYATIKRVAPQLPASLSNASETQFTVTGGVIAVNGAPVVAAIDDFRFNFTARIDVSSFTIADGASSLLFAINLTANFKLSGLQFDDAGSRWWGKTIASPICSSSVVSTAVGDLDSTALSTLVTLGCLAMQAQFNKNPFPFAVQLPASLVSPLYGRRGTLIDGSLPVADAVQGDTAVLNALTIRWMAQIQSLKSMSSAK
jgi:hypothetical protein